MDFLLLIETSTKVCSVALSREGKIIGITEENNPDYSHSKQLTVFIRKVVDEAGISIDDLDSVAVSRGPGSYTGLRIGTSVAKGLCYALNIPLISVDTLKAMTIMMLNSPKARQKKEKDVLFCPMIDARRMEVYNAVYDHGLKEIKPVSADVVDNNTFRKLLKDNVVWFFGDGAAKCRPVIRSANAYFCDDVLPSAAGMAPPAYENYLKKNFVNTAYFEPFYLKDFVAEKSKVKGLSD